MTTESVVTCEAIMIVGIDLNSRSVAMVGFPTKPDDMHPFWHKYTVPTKLMDRAEICGLLYADVVKNVFPEDQVYVEAPVLAGVKNVQSTIKVAAAYGAVLAAINSTRAVTHEVPVALWKVATVGKGNASKDDVGDWLHVQHPSVHRECAGDQDLMDAACIALYAELMERSSYAGARERRLLHQAP